LSFACSFRRAGGIAVLRPGAALVIGKLAIPVVVVVGAILRALWVSFPPPSGVPLVRRSVPALFSLIDTLTASLDTPRFHRVVLTDDFNAAVSQRPRLGPLGWYENWLMVGLPLLEALWTNFRAVLAHELGHLSNAHGRFGAWIYRIRMAWMHLMNQLESSHRVGYKIFDWFLKWWAPYFNAYSFVLAREQEYEADRQAAQLTGADQMGRALIAIALQGARMDRGFWPRIARRAVDHDTPPAGVFTELRETVRASLAVEDARRWLAIALNRKAATDDTHPSLRDRLAALDVQAPPPTPPPPAPTAGNDAGAADLLLGEARASLSDQVERHWRDYVAQGWRKSMRLTRDPGAARRARNGRTDRAADGLRSSERAQLTGSCADPRPRSRRCATCWRAIPSTPPPTSRSAKPAQREDATGVGTSSARCSAILTYCRRTGASWLYHEGLGHIADAADYRAAVGPHRRPAARRSGAPGRNGKG
jgi:hypothetical protein